MRFSMLRSSRSLPASFVLTLRKSVSADSTLAFASVSSRSSWAMRGAEEVATALEVGMPEKEEERRRLEMAVEGAGMLLWEESAEPGRAGVAEGSGRREARPLAGAPNPKRLRWLLAWSAGEMEVREEPCPNRPATRLSQHCSKGVRERCETYRATPRALLSTNVLRLLLQSRFSLLEVGAELLDLAFQRYLLLGDA